MIIIVVDIVDTDVAVHHNWFGDNCDIIFRTNAWDISITGIIYMLVTKTESSLHKPQY